MNESTLTEFAREFDPAVAPLLEPLTRCAEALAHTNDHEIERSIVPVVRDVEHQAGVLVEKVREKQTFVLVFGPLKSGKSTLMNALAATYVSEVTALPAYPCMVYVSHAPTSSVEVTRYDGTSEVLRDAAAVEELVSVAHVELARELAAAEERGETFDPGIHFPSALRRIDVHLPAEELRASGAVLVDTPGLYTRMKFGYDAMTRDFRHAAACAVFVVKTDNLFLEQVFSEFEQLLDLFTRIFLVVNVDPGKKDLGPHGELVPSAEAADPARVVEAFRTLTMTPRMRQADAEGRLRIHTIDLQGAARRRLRRETEETADPVGLEPMRGELHEFLSSSEYIVAFLRDSLRQGDALLDRLEEALGQDALEEIARRLDEDQGLLADARERLAALERAAAFDWDEALEDLDRRVAKDARPGLASARDRAARELGEGLDAWFDADESLQELVGTRTEAGLAGHLASCEYVARRSVAATAGGRHAGLEIGPELVRDLARAGVALAPLVPTLGGEHVAAPSLRGEAFDTDRIPVRRRLVDWLLFRSARKVRRLLFGEPGRPDLALPAAAKETRLGEAGREALEAFVAERTAAAFPRQEKAALDAFCSAHRTAFRTALTAAFEARRPDLTAEVAALDERVRFATGVVEPVRSLREETARSRGALGELHERFFPEPTVVLEPTERPDLEVWTNEGGAVVEPDEAPAERAEVAGEGGGEPRAHSF
jgi:hypothetical protein